MLFKTKRRKLEEKIKNLEHEKDSLLNNLSDTRAELDATNISYTILDNNYQHACEERDFYKKMSNTYKEQLDTIRKKNRDRQAKYRAKKRMDK